MMGVLTEVFSTPYDAEADLQQLLADHVHPLPGPQIDRDSPRRWLLIKPEAGIPNQEGGGDCWSATAAGQLGSGQPTTGPPPAWHNAPPVQQIL